MSANDLATLGAVSPFMFMDCISCQSEIQEKRITGEIVKGMSRGLEQCDASKILRNSVRINFGKGETASVDELLSSSRKGYAFEVVGSMIGFIEKKKIKDSRVNVGDKIIALKSSGFHSNGYTDLRHSLLNGDFETRQDIKKFYKGKHSLDYKFDGSTLGEMLLEPTRIYVQDIARAAKDINLTGINNTGYGLKNFNRVRGEFEFRITSPLKPQPIFDLMQEESGFSDKKMYQTFNMGMGFFIIVGKEYAEDAIQIMKGSSIVGEVGKGAGATTVLEKDGKKIVFEGY